MGIGDVSKWYDSFFKLHFAAVEKKVHLIWKIIFVLKIPGEICQRQVNFPHAAHKFVGIYLINLGRSLFYSLILGLKILEAVSQGLFHSKMIREQTHIDAQLSDRNTWY